MGRLSRPGLRLAALALILLAGSAPRLNAQRLRVRVVETGGNPAVGALVSLIGENGTSVERRVSNELGTATFPLAAGQTVRILIARPGFTDTIIGPLTGAGGLDSAKIALGTTRSSLAGVAVGAAPYCGLASALPPTAAPLWAEFQKALLLVQLAETNGLMTLNLLGFDRVVGLGGQVDSEVVNTVLGSANRPVGSLSREEAEGRGFAIRDSSGGRFFAPEVGFFLDDRFFATHCFTVVSGDANREGLIGLRYTPRDSTRSGLTGTMWFDPANRQPKSIDYHYTRLPVEWRPDRIGGEIELNRSNIGFWTTRFWYLRAPKLKLAKEPRGKDRLLGFREEGAEITSVSATVDTTDRQAVIAALVRQTREGQQTFGRVSGVVQDSVGFLLPNAEVTVLGVDLSTTTNKQGRFSIDGIPHGVQILRVRSVGFKPLYFSVRLSPGKDYDGKIGLAMAPRTLGEIVVVGKYGKPPKYSNTQKYDAFYRRRAGKTGKFLTREEIDKTAAGRIQDLLTGLPGVRVSFGVPGVSEEVTFAACPSGDVALWIDGTRLSGTISDLLPLITPGDVEAAEIYTRESIIPPEFRDSSCAAIVLWTR